MIHDTVMSRESSEMHHGVLEQTKHLKNTYNKRIPPLPCYMLRGTPKLVISIVHPRKIEPNLIRNRGSTQNDSFGNHI